MMAKQAQAMRYCFFCGEPIGVYNDWEPLDTCGQQDCEREARRYIAEQIEEDGREGR